MKIGMAGRLSWMMAAVLVAATVAGAQAPGGGVGPGFGDRQPPMERAFGPHGDHFRWWNNPKLAERLKLTDEQRKAFDAAYLEHREKLIDLRGSLEKAELAMEPLMDADQPNEAKILAQIDKLAQARAELEKANARFLLAIRAKLTPEQWKQLQADRAEHADRGQRRPEGQRHDGLGADKPGQGNQAAPPLPLDGPGEPQGRREGDPGGGETAPVEPGL